MLMNGYFGVKFDAPAFEDATQVPTPVGEPCLLCTEEVMSGESGIVTAFIKEDEAGYAPQHLECFLRSIFGSIEHIEGRCSCVGGEDSHKPYRAQAREVMEYIVAGNLPT